MGGTITEKDIPWLEEQDKDVEKQRNENLQKLKSVYEDMSGYNNWKPGDSVRKGGTRKIANLPKICSHYAHNPPNMMVYEDGIYEHVCPGCGAVSVFTVRNPTMGVDYVSEKGKIKPEDFIT
jgi:hypothetical protein